MEEDLGFALVGDAVFSVERVDHHPFKGFEGRQNFAVVEPTGSFDGVGSRSAHHGGLNGVSGVILSRSVLHISPNPKGSFVVRAHIVTSNHLDTVLVVVGLGSLAEFAVSPCDRRVIDVGTTHADLIFLVEISAEVTCVDLA